MRARHSSRTAIIPRPSRSTFRMPMLAQSSLSHWTTTRPGIAAEDLADLARGQAPAICDDVCRHGGSVLSVPLVHILDCALPPFAARQVQVDVGPLAPLFREEALEEQIHPHRIHGGNSQGVAHGAVGCRTAPLDQDALPPAELDNVPHDEEVAGKVEFLDQGELALDLLPGPLVVRPIALARPFVHALAQKARLGLRFGDLIAWKFVAEVFEREPEP